MKPELVHLTFSHYNEKARWGLDFKGVDHDRRGFDQLGPHEHTARALTGKTQLPILVVDGEIVAGSARILDWLEASCPDPPLYPEDPELRAEALALQAHFDEVVGPAIRWLFVLDLLGDRDYAARHFLGERAARIPVSEGDADAPAAVTLAAFDLVAERADPYLVGDRFSVADLAAAALLSIALYPPGFPFDFPGRDDEPMRGWFARYVEHPGADWVRSMYRTHRDQSAS